MGIPTDPHGSGGLLRPDADSGGAPNVCRGNGGTKFHNAIADERHPDASTSEHTRIHHVDRHANTSVLDGNGHVDTDPRAGDRRTCTSHRISDLSYDRRRANPSGHRGVQPVPMEALDRRDGDCEGARQEALISESLVEVTFESERKCRVAMGRWYGAFAGIYVEAPGDLDIDHLVPLKNAHDSGA